MSLQSLKQKLLTNPEILKEYNKLKPEFKKATRKIKKARKASK